MVFRGLVYGVLQHQLVSRLDGELPLAPSGILMDPCRWVHAAVQEQYQTTQVLSPHPIYSELSKDLRDKLSSLRHLRSLLS